MIKDGRACLDNCFGHWSQFCIYIHRIARMCALQMFILDRLVSYSPIWRHTSEELVWVHMARCALPAMSSWIWLKYRDGAAHLLEWWVLSRRYEDDGHGFDDTLVSCSVYPQSGTMSWWLSANLMISLTMSWDWAACTGDGTTLFLTVGACI